MISALGIAASHCSGTHPALDGPFELMEANPFNLDDMESIRVGVTWCTSCRRALVFNK